MVSDHSPCTPALKHLESGDFASAWGGIASLERALALIGTEARAARLRLIGDLARWMSAAPAKLAGLSDRKGRDRRRHGRRSARVRSRRAQSKCVPEIIQFRHKLTPYMGRVLDGTILETILRGTTIYKDAGFPGDRARPPAHPRTTSSHERVHAAHRSRSGAHRRPRGLDLRRLLRRQGEPPAAWPRRVHRRQVHRAWQVDGRLGVAAASRRRPRLVHREARRARRRPRRRRRLQPLPRQRAQELSSRRDARGRLPQRRVHARRRRREVDRARRRFAYAAWRAKSLPGCRRRHVHARAPAHLSRRRRGAAPRLRRGAAGLAAHPRRASCDRSRGRRARRRFHRRGRRVLLRQAQPHHARTVHAHGRRLGVAPPSRSRSRLGDRAARARGALAARHHRHLALQRQLPRQLRARGHARGRAHGGERATSLATADRAREARSAHCARIFDHRSAAGDARAAQHLPRRRRRAHARVRRGRVGG